MNSVDEVGALVFDFGSHSLRAGFAGEDNPKIPAFYVAKNAALTCFANGRHTGLVLDSGAIHTSAIPVYDGLVLTQEIIRSPLAGDFLLQQTQRLIDELNIDLVPYYKVASKEPVNEREPPKWKKRTNLPETTASYENYMVKVCFDGFSVVYYIMQIFVHASCLRYPPSGFSSEKISIRASGSSPFAEASRNRSGWLWNMVETSTSPGVLFMPSFCYYFCNKQFLLSSPHILSRICYKISLHRSFKFPTNVTIKDPLRQDIKLDLSNLNVDCEHIVSNNVLFTPFLSQADTFPMVGYEFPNGCNFDLGHERFQLPEALFDPSILLESGGSSMLSMSHIVASSISLCDIDIRPSLYNNVVVVGGTSLITGFTDRLQRDLNMKTPPSMRLKVNFPSTAAERRYSSWIGGSILGSLVSISVFTHQAHTFQGTFQQMWISSNEYNELGKGCVDKKCA
ncbi:actin-like protein 6A [Paragonimus westermani]|uniref:Actin-like protein 6A n=1 Tax=Paragonimus westermani TaxID=34504 RepID=A0A5J4NT54_9TREM|nr:actin-like protein 6A [Paragonimus westermani]